MNVVLVGPRGVGKSSVGRRLAQRAQLPFYDSDALLARRVGRLRSYEISVGVQQVDLLTGQRIRPRPIRRRLVVAIGVHVLKAKGVDRALDEVTED